MKTTDFGFPHDIYSEHLRNINGIQFTPREIDIISFIISGRSTKKTAAFFSISPKTVENHVHNIMDKLGCNSRERIIDFVEKSSQFELIKHYYSRLLTLSSFEQKLQKIGTLARQDFIQIGIFYWGDKKEVLFLLENFEKHLKLAGIHPKMEGYGKRKLFEYLSRKQISTLEHPIICFVTSADYTNLFKEDDSKEISISFIRNRMLHKTSPLIFVLIDNNSDPGICANEKNITALDLKNYYDAVFSILKHILPSKNVASLVAEVQSQSQFSYKKISFDNEPKNQKVVPIETGSYFKIAYVFIKRHIIGFSLIFMIILVISSILFFVSGRSTLVPLRTDLMIPVENNLLNRPEIFSQIQKAFKEKNRITTVAIVGMGGAGKTTIARQYALNQKEIIIWELNAETEASLKVSFEKLAIELAKSNEDLKILKEIRELKSATSKDSRILQFVRDKLRAQAPWLLIYDNLESMNKIQNYLPQDINSWGQGKIIVTTRDDNILDNQFIDSIVYIKELDEKQKLQLFCKIIDKGESIRLNHKQIQKAKEFLKSIPPFPLDISIAAYYLKSMRITYDKYLNRLNNYNKEFEKTQNTLLKEVGNYSKTREYIILLSLEQIIAMHADFKDLLLFMSHLDSQDIPRSLLEAYKQEAVVDNFIYHLKKHSLITSLPNLSLNTISLHRTIQKIIQEYLHRHIDFTTNKNLLLPLKNILEKALFKAIEDENFLEVRLLTGHTEKFISYHDILSDEIIGSLKSMLGLSYFYLGSPKSANKILEESQIHLNKNQKNNQREIAQLFLHMGIVNTDLGNYKEAIEILEKSLLIYNKNFAGDYVNLSRVYINLALSYRSIGSYEKAKNLLKNSFEIYQSHFPENKREIAKILAYLGNVQRNLGLYKEAKASLESCLSIYNESSNHKDVRVGRALSYLSLVYRSLGQFEKARSLLEDGLTIYKENFPSNHILVARSSLFLGNIYRSLEDFDTAKHLMEQGLVTYKFLTNDKLEGAWAIAHYGNLLREMGNFVDSKAQFELSLKIYKNNGYADHVDVAWILTHLGTIANDYGEHAQALEYMKKSFQLYEKYYPQDHVDKAWNTIHLGNTYALMNDFDTAINLIENGLMIIERCVGKSSIFHVGAIIHLAHANIKKEDYKRAKSLLEKGLSLLEDCHFKTNLTKSKVLKYLGQIHYLQGNNELAEDFFNKALNLCIDHKKTHVNGCAILELLGELYTSKSVYSFKSGHNSLALNQKNKAFSYFQQAQDIVELSFTKQNSHWLRLKSKIQSLNKI